MFWRSEGEKRSRTLEWEVSWFLGGMEEWRDILVVEVDECLKEVGACPGIAWVFLGCETAFGEIHRDSFSTGFEATSDVFLALFDTLVWRPT